LTRHIRTQLRAQLHAQEITIHQAQSIPATNNTDLMPSQSSESMSSSIEQTHSMRSSMEIERGSVDQTGSAPTKPSSKGPDDLAYSVKRWIQQQPHEEPYLEPTQARPGVSQ
jgi:hypothetical protein